MATALYDSCGKTCAGSLYTIFGIISLVGLYVNFYCGSGPKRQPEEPVSPDGEGRDHETTQELPEFTLYSVECDGFGEQ